MASAGIDIVQVSAYGELYGGVWPRSLGGSDRHCQAVQTKPLVYYSPGHHWSGFDVAVHLAPGQEEEEAAAAGGAAGDGSSPVGAADPAPRAGEGKAPGAGAGAGTADSGSGSDTDSESGRQFLDWPLVRALFRRAGLRTPPVLAARATRGEAAGWELPMESRVPAVHCGGAGLPADIEEGRDAEGVVVKCWAERPGQGLSLQCRRAMAMELAVELGEGAEGREYMAALGVTSEGAAAAEAAPAGGSGASGADAASGASHGSAHRALAPWLSAVLGMRRGKKPPARIVAKIKCARFEEAHGASWKGAVGAAAGKGGDFP